jgi:uncharacterized protein with PIN domain
MKIITDSNLGRLALRLRILGYDTIFYRGRADRSFLEQARQEDRIVLTRKRDLAKRPFAGPLYVVQSDRVESQLKEVVENFSMEFPPEGVFSRCLRCNVLLEEIGKELIADRVPLYVFEHYDRFRICPRCGSVYWPGTHTQNAQHWIKALHNPSHPH